MFFHGIDCVLLFSLLFSQSSIDTRELLDYCLRLLFFNVYNVLCFFPSRFITITPSQLYLTLPSFTMIWDGMSPGPKVLRLSCVWDAARKFCFHCYKFVDVRYTIALLLLANFKFHVIGYSSTRVVGKLLQTHSNWYWLTWGLYFSWKTSS